MESIQYAVLAPSIYNTQPWKFSLHENAVHLYPDLNRRLPVVDPQNQQLYLSLGCALENLVIALKFFGLQTEVMLFNYEHDDCIRVEVSRPAQPLATTTDSTLFRAIPKRQNNWRTFHRVSIPAEDLRKLNHLGLENGVHSKFFTDRKWIRSWINWTIDSDRIQMKEEDFREELLSWIRFGSFELSRFRDGIPAESLGVLSRPRWLASFFFRHYPLGESRAKRDAELIEGSAGLILFQVKNNNREGWVNAGRSAQRMALKLTSLGIQHSFMNQSLETPEVKMRIRDALETEGMFPQVLFRIGYADPVPRTVRRSIDAVIISPYETGTSVVQVAV